MKVVIDPSGSVLVTFADVVMTDFPCDTLELLRVWDEELPV